jgi:hypothetical protein
LNCVKFEGERGRGWLFFVEKMHKKEGEMEEGRGGEIAKS